MDYFLFAYCKIVVRDTMFRQLREIWEDPGKAALYCEILGSHSSAAADSSLLRCFAMSTGKQLPTF